MVSARKLFNLKAFWKRKRKGKERNYCGISVLRARSEISTGDDAEILKEILTGDEKGSVAGRKLLLDPGS